MPVGDRTSGPIIQNRGTIGGNIANASPAADTPPALFAYGAEIELVGPAGRRRVPYAAFHTGYKTTVREPSELIAAVIVPRPSPGRAPIQLYRKVGTRKAQAITALCAWAGFVFSLAVFAGFLVFGEQILGLFGEGQEQGKAILILLSIGLLVDAATGPSRIVLMMTGHERAYVRIFGTIIVAGILVQLVVIPVWGLLGAAAVNMVARIAAQLAIAWFAHRRIGLDTTLLGAFLVNRMADRRPA